MFEEMKSLAAVAVLGVLLQFSACARDASTVADIVLLNGKIFTAEPGAHVAQAVAIRGERILAVGTTMDVEALAGATTRRIDLQGRLVTPGFNDAHIHFVPRRKGVHLQFKTMEPSWNECLQAIQSAAREAQAGTWIFATVGSAVVLNDQVTRFALDTIAPNHPVLLRAYYGHGYIVNSKAMPLLKISEEEPDPMGGSFERVRDSRRINGRFWEYAEWKVERILTDEISDDEAVGQLRQMGQEAVGYGVTTLQMFSSLSIGRFARLLVKADLPIRVYARPFSITSTQGRDVSEIRQLANLKPDHPRASVGGIKWILDGTPFERGAAVRQPYHDKPDARGALNFPESEIASILKESLELNQPLLIHCAGDRCAEAVFDAMEKTGDGKVDWKTKRVRIEHADGVTGELLQRAQRLGVVVVLNPTHFLSSEMIFARYSPTTQFFPFRSYIEASVPVALGSDGPMNPFLNIMAASIHTSRPTEAVTRETAVRAYTFGSAFAEFADDEKGTLAKGKLADLTVLSQDIFAAPVPELPTTQSVLTIVGGKIVYELQPVR
jgi:predicted amidohydrolase YtcJ